MLITTTINIKSNLAKKLTEASELVNVSRNRIIALIIIKSMQNIKDKICMFKPVRYQDKDENANWKKMHVTYIVDVYEKAIDLRKIVKLSVSKIIAEGIRMYLDEIIKELRGKKDKTTDNYSHNYTFSENNSENIPHFTIFWGFPTKKFLKTYLP